MRAKYKSETSSINPKDTMLSIFGRFPLLEERSTLKNNPVYQEFQRRIREINSVATNKGYDVAYALLIINRNYKYRDWIDVPFGKFDELKMFVLNNIDRCYEIVG